MFFLPFNGLNFAGLDFMDLQSLVFGVALLSGAVWLWRDAGAAAGGEPSLLGSFALVAFGLPLSGMWWGSQHASTVMLGIWQVFDANGYERDAVNLWQHGMLDAFNGRRPLTAALLSGIFALDAGNVRITQVVLTFLNAISASVAARAMAQPWTCGRYLAFATLATFYITQTGSFLSENLGLPLMAPDPALRQKPLVDNPVRLYGFTD